MCYRVVYVRIIFLIVILGAALLAFTVLRSGYGTAKTVPVFCGYGTVNFFVSFMPTKDLALFSIYTPQKPSFKPINDQFTVAGICCIQRNQPTWDFGW